MSEHAAASQEPEQPGNTLVDLPPEMIAHITSLIDYSEALLNFSRTSQLTHNIVAAERIQTHLILLLINELLIKIDNDSDNVNRENKIGKVLKKFRISETNVPDSEKDELNRLILKYRAVFYMLCKSPAAWSLIRDEGNPTNDGLAFSARMVTLFKCYLYTYAPTTDDPFAANPKGILTPTCKLYLQRIKDLPFLTDIQNHDPKSAAPAPPTEEQWSKIFNGVKARYSATLLASLESIRLPLLKGQKTQSDP